MTPSLLWTRYRALAPHLLPTPDPRGLALWRVLLALAVLAQALDSMGSSSVLLSDHGLLPRAVLAASGDPWRLSLFMVNGSALWSLLLLLAQALGALALLFGWHSRAAALACLLLAASLINRAPLAASAADTWLCALLLWSLPLPLGARWSLDAANARKAPPATTGGGGVSLMLQLQLLLMPLQVAVTQTQQLPWGSVGLLLLLPALLLAPLPWNWSRSGTSLLLAGAAAVLLAMGATGCAWLLACGAALWLPAALFDAATPRTPPTLRTLRIYYDRDCAFCLHSVRILRELLILPQAELIPAQSHPRADALRVANQSWVVIDSDDRAYLRWSAMRTLLKASPIARPALPLIDLLIADARGDRLYRHCVNHRARWARWTAWMVSDVQRWQASATQQGAALALGLLALIWNLGQLGIVPVAQAAVEPLIRLCNLDVRIPTDDDRGERLLLRLRLNDQRQIDPRQPGKADSDHLTDGQVDRRADVRRHVLGLLAEDQAPARDAYVSWWCTRWNAERPAQAPDHADELRLIAVTPDPSSQRIREQRIAARAACPE